MGVSAYSNALAVFTCQFCEGWGHTAKHCATKKSIDRVARGNPLWKVTWGTVKAGVVGLGKRQRTDVTVVALEAEIGRVAVLNRQRVAAQQVQAQVQVQVQNLNQSLLQALSQPNQNQQMDLSGGGQNG